MFLKKFLNLALIIACTTSACSINAATIINTPNGQFSVPGGQTACTAIAVNAAAQLLTIAQTEWARTNIDQLILAGVTAYNDITLIAEKPATYFFQAQELTPHFPELQQLAISQRDTNDAR